MKIMKVDEFNEEGIKRFGPEGIKWKFVCPRCKTIQSGEDLVAAGLSNEEAKKNIGYNCIGRFNDKKTGCDWSLGGLFKLHKMEVEDDEGKKHPFFEFAESA